MANKRQTLVANLSTYPRYVASVLKQERQPVLGNGWGITQTIVHTPVGRASVLLHASMGNSKSECIIILRATTKTKGKHFALCVRFEKKGRNAWATTCVELIRVWQFGRPLLPRGCNDNAVDNDNNSSMRCRRSIKNNKKNQIYNFGRPFLLSSRSLLSVLNVIAV